VIALLTDFGFKDSYVGVMKGVILRRAPGAPIVDLCHNVMPQDVLEAGFVLSGAYEYFPDGTVFVCVVDPGVGSKRRILCMETPRHLFLAPDNGLLSVFMAEIPNRTFYEVTNESLFLESVSDTFHGRDIFAPVAAALAMGLDPERLGPKTERVGSLDLALPIRTADGVLRGQVIYVDQFGNVITNLSQKALEPDVVSRRKKVVVRIGGREIRGLSKSYKEAGPRGLLAIMGSSGYLEISVNGGSAQAELQTNRGDEVTVSFEK
jgi:S-adenosylmethionine hydrolase